ncbi:MAG TPA: alpha/beta fold hydrolase [Acidimicrobiales bacterium]|jgi:pimeloyl-ACP methyl ester carboxylesterase|nr:alpha/beta fold hydrolase [Acidimicrobiales bacterium]
MSSNVIRRTATAHVVQGVDQSVAARSRRLVVSEWTITVTMHASRFSSFDGTSIHYLDLHDEGDVPTVVMLHGFGSDAQANWVDTGIAERLTRAGFRVVMPDARGHGASDKPHHEDAYRPPAMARDVSSLIDHLGLGAAHLVGYSMGSTTAINAATLDARISKLVLGGAGSALLHADSEPFRRHRAKTAAVLELDEPGDDVDTAALALRRFVEEGGGDRLAMAAVMRAEEGLVAGALGIANPVLVISGRDDSSSGDPHALAKLLPNGRAEHIAGHHLSAVRDPALAEHIIEFLRP